MKSYCYPTTILLPKEQDLTAWAVVACDQFTSQPEYWQEADRIVGEKPSTLRMILPESKLHSPNVAEEIEKINNYMVQYQKDGIFRSLENAMIYLERTQSDGKVRRGIIGAVDLEEYDYSPKSTSLIRATEGTVLERIPPRVKVREHATLELPHIMLLIDDPQKTLIETFGEQTSKMEALYDVELMLGGGHQKAWLLTEEQKAYTAKALAALAGEEEYPLLFAVGDGNHSLATAKTCWETIKKTLSPEERENHPARFALVEIVNLHDTALEFEAIHRVLFDVSPEKVVEAFLKVYPNAYRGKGEGHTIHCITAEEEFDLTVPDPQSELTVATLQTFLDAYLKEQGGTIDYIHGEEVTRSLAQKQNAMGFLLPSMEKSQLFPSVQKDGVLPRKTFSMGHAEDKRYYIEAREIARHG